MTEALIKSHGPYRIKIDSKTYRLLNQDKRLFNSPSFNAFINKVIYNYYVRYQRSNFTFMKLKNILKEHIERISKKKVMNDDVIDIVKQIYAEMHYDLWDNQPSSESISIRPTKERESVWKCILENQMGFIPDASIIDSYSVGTFLKQMLISYSKLSTIERESIFFEDELVLLADAINNKKVMRIETLNKSMLIHPYALTELMSDFGNQLVCYCEESKQNEIIAIRTLRSIIHNGDKYQMSDEIESAVNEYLKVGIIAFDENEIKLIKKVLEIAHQNDINDEKAKMFVRYIKNAEKLDDPNAKLIHIK
jgi:hypothetical protein